MAMIVCVQRTTECDRSILEDLADIRTRIFRLNPKITHNIIAIKSDGIVKTQKLQRLVKVTRFWEYKTCTHKEFMRERNCHD